MAGIYHYLRKRDAKGGEYSTMTMNEYRIDAEFRGDRAAMLARGTPKTGKYMFFDVIAAHY